MVEQPYHPRTNIVIVGNKQEYHMLYPLVHNDYFDILYVASVTPEHLLCASPALVCLSQHWVHTVQQVRHLFPYTPIIVALSQPSPRQEASLVTMLQQGADDVIASTCGREEWQARLRARLRQYPTPLLGMQSQDGMLTLTLAQREVVVGTRSILLSMKEHVLLYLLMRYAEQTLSSRFLLQTIWGVTYQKEVDYIRVYMSQVRRKLEERSDQPRYLETVSGIGYRFRQACISKSENS
ncbi:winged helix-turn-helix domain-containing protein [Ktedonospora formicarum]|uniref:OmpR/PhoB-type domain-containing protein n=1 Tax=Ktedonospora formicarum TaxID=2778364 RepID=A0A8J3IGU2_9CHLR|nr:response regulator transcription factor [Ktedonospora formicarum]GHO50904.1 hypothetical protein KSX_90670 [Ktedonospora formicarum]